jgi:plasmid stabilization system protein ParE
VDEYQVVWAEPALADLQAIISYVARQSQAGAERVRSSILNHVDILGSFPLIGPVYPRDRRGRAREIVCGQYRIFYRVDESAKRVEILTVWHGARREPTLPG